MTSQALFLSVYYYPTIAKRKAAFALEQLQAQADVIGREALATKEIVGVAPAFALADFVSQFLQKHIPSADGEAGKPGSAVSAGLIAAAAAQSALPVNAKAPER